MTRRPVRTFAAYGFASTHDALAAEAALRAASIPVLAVPAPRELGSLCGIAMRLELCEAQRAESELVSAGIAWAARVEFEDI